MVEGTIPLEGNHSKKWILAMWWVWKTRNELLFEGHPLSPTNVIYFMQKGFVKGLRLFVRKLREILLTNVVFLE